MVSRSCRCRCSTASSSCWARSSRGGCGGGLPPSPSPAFPRSTPAASPRDQPAPGPHSIAARPPPPCRPPPPRRRSRAPLSCAPPRPHRSPSSRLGVAVPLSCPARRRGRASGAGSWARASLPPGSGSGRMSTARPCAGLRAAVAAGMGLSDGPAGSGRSCRLLRPPAPAPAVPGARLLRLPESGAVQAASPGWTEALRAAVAELRAGAVVAVPTDTLYGLACSASCSAALGCVYRLKGRSEAKPLAVCLGRVADVYRYCQVSVPKELLEDLLPGPVTLVMQRSGELNKDLNPFTPLVGIRIPNHAFMQDLAQMFGGPIALTSANLSSQASSLSVEEFQDLWPHLSLVIDGGPIGASQSPECRLGSTVVDLSVPGKFTIIRPGCALENTTIILQQKYGLLPSQGTCS